jgi:hypothetical protein
MIMKEEKAAVSVETLNKVLNYLASKPFAEVHELIGLIQQAEVIKEEEK